MRPLVLLSVLALTLLSCGKPYYERIDRTTLAQGVTQTTLPNGLTVLVKEDRRSPVVAVRCYVLTGSVHEETWLGSGLSHFFEHALFLGTAKRPDQQRIASDVEALGGGNFNAYTTHDHTCYLFTVGADSCREGLSILADMIGNSTFPPAAVTSEQQTIHKEMAMNEDDADRVFSKLFNRSFFTASPYRYPVIGYREIYDRLSLADIRTYYQTRYIPANMVLVITGDITKEKALAAASSTFGSLARRPVKDIYVPDEPVHTSRREFIEYSDKTKMPLVEIGFQTVSVSDEDMFPLDLLASILSEKSIGVLDTRLVEGQKLAYRAEASSWTPRTRGLFGWYAELMPGKSPADFEAAVFDIIADVQRGGISREAIERAKNSTVVNAMLARESVDGTAGALGGNFIWTGNYAFDAAYLDGITKVRAADIARVAKKYFVRTKETLVAMLPPAEAAKTATRSAERYTARAVVTNLGNGITVVSRRSPAQTVSAAAVMRGGLICEDATNNGAFHVLANTMVRASRDYPKDTLFAAISARGGSLTAESGNYYLAVKIQMLKNDASEAVRILGSVVSHPALLREDIDVVKQETELSLKKRERDAFYQGGMRFRSRFYSGHPYARPVYGTTNTLKGIDRQMLTALHKRYATGNNIVVAIAGDLPAETLIGMVRASFSGIPRGRTNDSAGLETPAVTASRSYIDTMPGFTQSVINIGMRGPARYSDDYYPVEVLCNILDGMGGRLFTAVRGANSLAYSVGCYQSPKYKSGAIVLYAATETAERRTPLAAKLMRDEVLRLFTENITSDRELARAKNIAATEIDRALQSTSFEAFELALRAFCGADPNDLYRTRELFSAVTRADMLAAANRYFNAYIEDIATQ